LPGPAVHEALRAYLKLLRAAKAVVAGVEPRLAAAGLTLTQFGVLEAARHKGALTQRKRSRLVLSTAGNITDVVDKLESRGRARRRHCGGHERARYRRALHPQDTAPPPRPRGRARHRGSRAAPSRLERDPPNRDRQRE
jgi:hypothetical protein